MNQRPETDFDMWVAETLGNLQASVEELTKCLVRDQELFRIVGQRIVALEARMTALEERRGNITVVTVEEEA
jgi:hypothetical protein